MDLHFVEPDETPVPPEQIRVRRLVLHPMPDGRRVRVQLELTPFLERPTVDVTVTDSSGDTVAATSIIETVDHELEFTLHLRRPGGPGGNSMRVEAGYEQQSPVDVKEVEFELPPA
jgi:hypothetical protein